MVVDEGIMSIYDNCVEYELIDSDPGTDNQGMTLPTGSRDLMISVKCMTDWMTPNTPRIIVPLCELWFVDLRGGCSIRANDEYIVSALDALDGEHHSADFYKRHHREMLETIMTRVLYSVAKQTDIGYEPKMNKIWLLDCSEEDTFQKVYEDERGWIVMKCRDSYFNTVQYMVLPELNCHANARNVTLDEARAVIKEYLGKSSIFVDK